MIIDTKRSSLCLVVALSGLMIVAVYLKDHVANNLHVRKMNDQKTIRVDLVLRDLEKDPDDATFNRDGIRVLDIEPYIDHSATSNSLFGEIKLIRKLPDDWPVIRRTYVSVQNISSQTVKIGPALRGELFGRITVHFKSKAQGDWSDLNHRDNKMKTSISSRPDLSLSLFSMQDPDFDKNFDKDSIAIEPQQSITQEVVGSYFPSDPKILDGIVYRVKYEYIDSKLQIRTVYSDIAKRE